MSVQREQIDVFRTVQIQMVHICATVALAIVLEMMNTLAMVQHQYNLVTCLIPFHAFSFCIQTKISMSVKRTMMAAHRTVEIHQGHSDVAVIQAMS